MASCAFQCKAPGLMVYDFNTICTEDWAGQAANCLGMCIWAMAYRTKVCFQPTARHPKLVSAHIKMHPEQLAIRSMFEMEGLELPAPKFRLTQLQAISYFSRIMLH